MNCKHKVYIIPAKMHYMGASLVAADSVEEANQIIDDFKEQDAKNEDDSGGYGHVDANHEVEDIFATRKGILRRGIYYYG